MSVVGKQTALADFESSLKSPLGLKDCKPLSHLQFRRLKSQQRLSQLCVSRSPRSSQTFTPDALLLIFSHRGGRYVYRDRVLIAMTIAVFNGAHPGDVVRVISLQPSPASLKHLVLLLP
jgi:hypothetical protein